MLTLRRLWLAFLIALALPAAATEIPSLPPFMPAGNYVAMTASPSGATATLPISGGQVVIYNQGDDDAIVQIGGSGLSPSLTGEVVRAHGFLELSVGSATTIAAETASGSSALLISGGIGGLNAGGAPAAPVAADAVGAANLATAQAPTIGTSATLIAGARTGAPGTGRVAITILNTGTVTIYIGAAGVTASTGASILAGASRTILTTAAIYAVTASGTGACDVLETF